MSRISDLIKELCPNGVVFKAVGDMCNVYTGGETPTDLIKEKVPRGDYIYPVYSNGIGSNALYGYAKAYRIKDDAVTFSSIGTLGHPEIRKGKFTPIIRLKVLVPIDLKKLSIGYLKYALETAEFDNNKSSLPNLNANMLKNIVIPIPPLEVQNEIVRILDKFCELEVELEAELEARKSQYEFWREKLLKSDKNTVKLKNITSIITKGTTPTSIGFNFEIDGEVNFVKIESINNGIFNLNKLEHISNDCNEKLSRSKLQENDILFSIAGAIGKTIIVDNSILPANTNQALAIIRISDSNYNIKYINYYLNSSYIKTQYTDKQKGSAQINVSLNDILNFEIPVINIDEQNRIVNILDKFDKLVNDMTVGLPAEIELRRKQYEYYRNKLLSFEEYANE